MDDDVVMSWDGPNQAAPNLTTLPTELLDKIFGHLRPNIRLSNLPRRCDQSWLKHNDDDRAKRKGLHSLCRTTKRLRKSATPLLYTDIHVVGWRKEKKMRQAFGPEAPFEFSMDEQGIVRQLTRLLRTFKERSELAKYIQVIRCNQSLARRTKEDGLDEQHDDMVLAIEEAIDEGLPTMVQGLFNPIVAGIWEREFRGVPEKAQMTLLLWLSPNVSELTLGTYSGSLSRLLGLELGSSRLSQFVKLATINVITDSFILNDDHNGVRCLYPEPESYDDCIATFRYLPALEHYRHREPYDIQRALLGLEAVRLPFEGDGLRNLSTLHLVDCHLSMQQIIMTVGSCYRLRGFRFQLGFLSSYDEPDDTELVLDCGGICEALLQSKDTLRYLSLSPIDARSSDQSCSTLAVGTINKFTKLQTLLVPAMILTETPITITYTSEEAHWDPTLDFQLRVVESLPT